MIAFASPGIRRQFAKVWFQFCKPLSKMTAAEEA
jgi:hypothetical protein